MLTPAFELGQDEKFVFVYMKTPYIKAQDVEYFIEENLFKFYVKPYFLRLNFPGKIIENGEESASYDVDKGLFTVRLPKLVPGAHFPDLDLVTKLLAPSGKCNISTPGIEVVSENAASNSDDEEDFDWEWSQEFYDEKEEERLVVDGCKYGFGNKKSGVFHRLKDELKDVVENPNPDELSYRERRLGRIASENEKFDEEHYLADLFDDVRIKEILDYVTEKEASFDDIEKKKLQQLPNREYVFEKKEENFVCYSLVDIIFAYAYNKRTTFGENTVESAWTISKLSPTLSWLERFTNVEDVLVACVRRSLSYPLFRNWDLSCRVLQDVKDIFKYGRRRILKCLLEILKLFNESEPRYLLNELYITDYCVWIQKVKEKKVDSLAKKLSQTKITKESINWDLKSLETAAVLVYNEEKNHTSDSELSSSESSTDDTDDDTESNDTTDSDPADEKCIHKSALNFSESTNFCSDDVVSGENAAVCEISGLCNGSSNFEIERNEQNSDEETLRKVEVPSLLLFSNPDAKRTLVEIIDDDDDDDDDVNNVCSSSCENVNCDNNLGVEVVSLDKRKGNKAINNENKELVSSQATDKSNEQEISSGMSRLLINS